jgi:DNA modification methylase
MNELAIDQVSGQDYTAVQGDCVKVMSEMPEGSIHMTCTSIPFASLLTYSSSDHDMGNVSSHSQFWDQYVYFAKELLRVTMPGRIAAIHNMILPSSKTRDGVIGLLDFRGDLVRVMQAAGWIFHSETAIRKDPVTAMQRTKAIGLLHKQLKKDSCMSRTGILDYLDAFRKPGVNPERVTHTNESYPVSKWQQIAEPVWDDINQSETLQFRSARDEKDELHLAPLQTQVISRCIELWSNPGDIIFDPFGGIGSTGVVALGMSRKTVMCELKESYYRQMVKNLKAARKQRSLFDVIDEKKEEAAHV